MADTKRVFISYAHEDEAIRQELGKTLRPLEREGKIETWHDRKIAPGADWHAEISNGLDRSDVVLLLVSRDFLASDYIHGVEMKRVLERRRRSETVVVPIIVRHCDWSSGPLAGLQALPTDGNPIMSAEDVDAAWTDVAQQLRRQFEQPAPAQDIDRSFDELAAMRQIQRCLEETAVAFQAQARQRDELVGRMRARLEETDHLEFERFFFRHYPEMNDEERFVFQQIRATTEGPLQEGNRRIFELLEQHPELLGTVSLMRQLRTHLRIWLNKYDRIFVRADQMCLLYVGVEEGVGFPTGIDDQVAAWIKNNS